MRRIHWHIKRIILRVSCVEATLTGRREGIDETNLIGWTIAIVALARAEEKRTLFGDGSQSIHFMITEQRTCNARISAAVLVGAFNLLTVNEEQKFNN